MDYQKKKLLTQSVSFLQANLHITPEFLGALKIAEVLTSEEISTIQKDDTMSGKIVEMVCLLKRKDNRTFSKFIQVLEKIECKDAVDLLKNVEPSKERARTVDPRVLDLLEKQLGTGIIPMATLHAVAAGMVLKEIYKDEVSNLSEKVSHLQKSLRSKIAAGTTRASVDSLATSPTSDGRSSVTSMTVPPLNLSDRPVTGRSSKQVPAWDVPSQMQEANNLIKEKDGIIKRKDEEYVQLRRVLQDTQSDLQNVLDLNAQYLAIISHYNQMQLTIQTSAQAMPEKSVAELEHKLSEAETRVAQLSGELDVVNNETTSKEKELHKLEAKQKKYRELLGIPDGADDTEVENCIERLLADGTNRSGEITDLKNELKRVMQTKAELGERLTTLAREKEKIEFHLRQQELTIKKIKRHQTARGTIQQAVSYIESQSGDDRIATQVKLPSIERIGSQIGLAAKQNRSNQQFCVFCRTEYLPLKAQSCRIHFRPIRNGKWTCCRDDCHRSPGCLQVPHFYMEITVDRKIFLTDGGRYMELSYLSHSGR